MWSTWVWCMSDGCFRLGCICLAVADMDALHRFEDPYKERSFCWLSAEEDGSNALCACPVGILSVSQQCSFYFWFCPSKDLNDMSKCVRFVRFAGAKCSGAVAGPEVRCESWLHAEWALYIITLDLKFHILAMFSRLTHVSPNPDSVCCIVPWRLRKETQNFAFGSDLWT